MKDENKLWDKFYFVIWAEVFIFYFVIWAEVFITFITRFLKVSENQLYLSENQLYLGNVKPLRKSMIYVSSSPRIWHNFILVSLLLLPNVQNNKVSGKEVFFSFEFLKNVIIEKKYHHLVRRMGCLYRWWCRHTALMLC